VIDKSTLVIVVEDDTAVRSALGEHLQHLGFAVRQFAGATDGLDVVSSLGSKQSGQPGCLVINVRLQRQNGIELLKRLRSHGCDLPAIMIGAFADADLVMQAFRAGACDFLEKPFHVDQLADRIRRVVHKCRQPGLLTRITARLTPAEALLLYEEIAPRLLIGILRGVRTEATVAQITSVAEHLCSPDVVDRLRKSPHVGEALVAEVQVQITLLGIPNDIDESLVQAAISECGVERNLKMMEACLVHSCAA